MNKILSIIILSLLFTSCGNEAKKETTAATTVTKAEPLDPLEESVKRGREIYSELCVTCHLPNGKGVPGAFPPLNPSDWLTKKRTESIHAVKYGLKGEIVVNGDPYNSVMLPLGLDDQEVADVMNYTIQTWNKGDMVTMEEVAAVEKE
ncbi:c550-like class I cytochrome C [Nonlabens sp. YIK11]|uniref:c-type cytochrome n=1 Tax=Nonlabens sp. YIK11 TaxID=1453349 RepID=UPI0006DC2006|nr:cytochrome c [Nonlabens sp. YIK11]KQC34024.1 c550-like class I cytochrome C [Nonlabens sp. YIK11]